MAKTKQPKPKEPAEKQRYIIAKDKSVIQFRSLSRSGFLIFDFVRDDRKPKRLFSLMFTEAQLNERLSDGRLLIIK